MRFEPYEFEKSHINDKLMVGIVTLDLSPYKDLSLCAPYPKIKGLLVSWFVFKVWREMIYLYILIPGLRVWRFKVWKEIIYFYQKEKK